MRIFRQRGFTLVEIIIVLAIGVVISTIAFVTIPLAKRMMRDAQRKSDLYNTGIAFKAYASAHEGCLPSTAIISSGAACDDASQSIVISGGAISNSSKIVTGGYYDPAKIGTDPSSNSAYQFVQSAPAGCSSSSWGRISYQRSSDKEFSLSVCLETNDTFTQNFAI